MYKFISKYAVCPYYRKHEGNQVCCEGTEGTNTIHVAFCDKPHQKDYEKRFCNNIDGYQDCLICSMLNQKYEE